MRMTRASLQKSMDGAEREVASWAPLMKGGRSKDLDALVDMERRLATLAVEARRLAQGSGLTRAEIARRMGMPIAAVRRILGPKTFYDVSLETLWRFAIACGAEMRCGDMWDTAARHAVAAGRRIAQTRTRNV